MKKFIITAIFSLFLFSCSQDSDFGTYGDDNFDPKDAIEVNELYSMLESSDSVETTLTGNISAVCQSKGCWLGIAAGEDQMLRVTFKDYGFFVPKNSKGEKVAVHGKAFKKTISVAMQQEYAKDAGESIEDITEDKIEYTFVADGVIYL